MPGTEIDDITRELITKHKVGGVILYRKNILSLEHFIGLLNSLRELNKDNFAVKQHLKYVELYHIMSDFVKSEISIIRPIKQKIRPILS